MIHRSSGFAATNLLLKDNCRHANIPAFGGILPLFTPFPAIPRGIHEIPLLQMLRNVINRTDNYSTWHLSYKPEYVLLHHQ
jgi:hypothetical protein